MKILHITDLYPYRHIPTRGIFVKKFTEAITHAGINNSVLVPLRIVPSRTIFLNPRVEILNFIKIMLHPKIIKKNGIEANYLKYVSPIRNGYSVREDAEWFLKIQGNNITKKIKKYNPDIIMAHSIPNCGVIAHHIRKKCGLRYACFVHEDIELYLEDNPHMRETYKTVLSEAAFIIANSGQTQRKINSLVENLNVFVINLGTEIPPLKQIEKKEEIKKKDYIRIISVSNLLDAKGFLDLFKSCRILLDRYKPEIKWIVDVFGYGHKLPEYKKMITKLNLQNNIFLRGAVEQEVLLNEYINSDIFILLTHNDSYGTVFVEAMAGGCILIGTDRAGCVEDIQKIDPGLVHVVDYMDHAQVASVLNYIINNVDKERQISRMREIAINYFSWEKCANDFMQIIENYNEDKGGRILS